MKLFDDGDGMSPLATVWGLRMLNTSVVRCASTKHHDQRDRLKKRLYCTHQPEQQEAVLCHVGTALGHHVPYYECHHPDEKGAKDVAATYIDDSNGAE